MNLLSLATLISIMVFYAWRAASQSKADGVTTLQQLTPSLKRGSGFRELLFFGIFLLTYKYSRAMAIGDESTAFANAYRVVDWEKQLGIFWEIPIQQWFLGHVDLVKILNWTYINLHLPTTIIFFTWLFHRRNSDYRFIRNMFLVSNIITIFIFVWFPCAPPRMLGDLGFVDTLLKISDVNLYKGNLSKLFNQYAAMPSMHFGNSLLIAIAIMTLHEIKWLRVIIPLYPLFVLTVIVLTGNHFFLDAAVGGFLIMLPYPIAWWLEKQFPSWRPTIRGTNY